MAVQFQIHGLQRAQFNRYFTMSDRELADEGACRTVADSSPGYPCRISLEDAEVGEELILLPYQHHPAPGPYRSSGPIYVRVDAAEAQLSPCEVPQQLRRRLLSVRGYDREGMMSAADVVDGKELESTFDIFFSDARVRYIHVHNARPGCFACRVERAG